MKSNNTLHIFNNSCKTEEASLYWSCWWWRGRWWWWWWWPLCRIRIQINRREHCFTFWCATIISCDILPSSVEFSLGLLNKMYWTLSIKKMLWQSKYKPQTGRKCLQITHLTKDQNLGYRKNSLNSPVRKQTTEF